MKESSWIFLPTSLNYNVSAAVSLQGTTFFGTRTFPLPARSVVLSGDVTKFKFTVPPTQFVRITGLVIDTGGNPVGGALISASSQLIAGGLISHFTTSGQADSNGNYNLTVLKGTNYTMSFNLPQNQ